MNSNTKLIIKCPDCEYKDGVVQSIAEVLDDGVIAIRRSTRFFTGVHEQTLIVGQDFSLACGRCGALVFRKMPVIVEQQKSILLGTF